VGPFLFSFLLKKGRRSFPTEALPFPLAGEKLFFSFHFVGLQRSSFVGDGKSIFYSFSFPLLQGEWIPTSWNFSYIFFPPRYA